MLDFLINASLLAIILVTSAIMTNLYVKWAYNRCAACGALNAKRRSQCRMCSQLFTDNEGAGAGPQHR